MCFGCGSPKTAESTWQWNHSPKMAVTIPHRNSPPNNLKIAECRKQPMGKEMPRLLHGAWLHPDPASMGVWFLLQPNHRGAWRCPRPTLCRAWPCLWWVWLHLQSSLWGCGSTPDPASRGHVSIPNPAYIDGSGKCITRSFWRCNTQEKQCHCPKCTIPDGFKIFTGLYTNKELKGYQQRKPEPLSPCGATRYHHSHFVANNLV